MIKNIVFDMGHVLLDYDPIRVCWEFTDQESDVNWMKKELFFSEEWLLLDEGAITEAEAMSRIRNRLPDQRLKDLADQCMAHWHEYNITPKPGMGHLVQELKEQGLRIYLCSNVSLRLRVFEDQLPGIQYFDGILISAEEHLLKPDPAIFQRLFEKFSIRPEESYFIDDLKENVESAKRCGMDGYCFSDGDVEKLRKELTRLWRV